MIKDKNKEGEVKINEDVKELVVTRIESQATPNLRLSIGGSKSLSKEEMIMHVKKDDEIGRQIITSHLRFIQAIANGKLTKALESV